MYPVFRLIKERLKFGARQMGLLDTHVSHHMCWPWDLDPWMELNNGRTLTLYDLGRIPMFKTAGIITAMTANGWGMTVAGSTVRYRRRIRMFHRFETRTQIIGWDHRFLYVEQSMWRGGEALNHLLVRMAATQTSGILPPDRLLNAMGHKTLSSPVLPDWALAWINAEALRPWPPKR